MVGRTGPPVPPRGPLLRRAEVLRDVRLVDHQLRALMAGRRRWTLDRITCHVIFWLCVIGIPVVANRH